MEFMKFWLIGSWCFSFCTVAATYNKANSLGYEIFACLVAMAIKWGFIGWIPYAIYRLM